MAWFSRQKKQPIPLQFGHMYMPKFGFKSWFSKFGPSDRLVYLSSATSVYDNAVGFFFWNVDLGAQQRLDMDWGAEQTYDFDTQFHDCGPDMVVQRIETADLNFGQASNWQAFRPFIAYLTDLVQGTEDIESWFVFVSQHRQEFSRELTRADFLRLSQSGYSMAIQILRALQVSFYESPRYAWIGTGSKRQAAPLP